MVNMMMTGVTRSGDGTNFERRHSHDFIVLQNFDALGRNGRDFPQKPFHVVAENAHGRLDQFCGIEQVRRAAWMHVNRCSFRETPGGAGMVEMNVTQKNMAHVFRVRPGLAESSSHVIEGRFRAGVEQCDTVVRPERGRGHNPGTAKWSRSNNGDQGRIKKYELRNRGAAFERFQNCDKDSDQFVALSTESI